MHVCTRLCQSFRRSCFLIPHINVHTASVSVSSVKYDFRMHHQLLICTAGQMIHPAITSKYYKKISHHILMISLSFLYDFSPIAAPCGPHSSMSVISPTSALFPHVPMFKFSITVAHLGLQRKFEGSATSAQLL